MGLFWGPRGSVVEERGTLMPSLPSSWFDSGSFGTVDASAGDTSLQSVAVRTTVDLICSLASELPLAVYTDQADGTSRRVKTPANVLDPGGDGAGIEDWMYRLLQSYLLRGNAYGFETSHDGRGKPRTIDLVNPDDVSALVVEGKPEWFVGGHEVTKADNFRHWRVNPVAGRLLGLSPIRLHAATIGVSLASTRFGSQWFTDGAHPSGMLTNEADLTAEQAKIAKDRFLAAIRGSREPVVLGRGWQWSALQIKPDESQFLETQGFTEAQCARMFGPGFAEVLGYETGGSMTYANVVDRRQDLLVLSMNKWIRRAERVLSSLVPPQQYVRLNRDALLEATTLQRYQAHALALQHKWRTVNEIRAVEDLPPVAWGNEPVGEVEGVADGNADV